MKIDREAQGQSEKIGPIKRSILNFRDQHSKRMMSLLFFYDCFGWGYEDISDEEFEDLKKQLEDFGRKGGANG